MPLRISLDGMISQNEDEEHAHGLEVFAMLNTQREKYSKRPKNNKSFPMSVFCTSMPISNLRRIERFALFPIFISPLRHTYSTIKTTSSTTSATTPSAARMSANKHPPLTRPEKSIAQTPTTKLCQLNTARRTAGKAAASLSCPTGETRRRRQKLMITIF